MDEKLRFAFETRSSIYLLMYQLIYYVKDRAITFELKCTLKLHCIACNSHLKICAQNDDVRYDSSYIVNILFST